MLDPSLKAAPGYGIMTRNEPAVPAARGVTKSAMKPVLLCVGALFVAAAAGQALAKTVTDSAGRNVDVPDEIRTVYAAGGPASVLVYMLRPDALAGWPRALREWERPYVPPAYRDLPETGMLTGRGGEANLERMLELDPDVIVDFGSVRDTFVSLADRVQRQTGIPYLLFDGRLENTADSLRRVGAAIGVPERGERLAADIEARLARVDAVLARVPEQQRPRVYLARGPDGLETGLRGSINTEILERAGGRNVAYTGDGRRGLTQASIEQVIAVDPDTIVTWDPNFYSSVWSNPLWAGITAVRTGRVFLSPTAPFGWIDRPPSVNRFMGLTWLAGLFYPEFLDQDLRTETRDFYRLYYHVDLSDEELDRLLEWARGKAP